MDSCCATLKATMRPMQVSKGVNHGDGGFWGKKISCSVKNRGFGTQLLKNLRTQNRSRKIKPRIAVSVVTTDINDQMVAPVFEHPEVDPKKVASIIPGGGAGTHLFPLTSRRPKPAVLAAMQTPGEAGKKWFQGTADAARQFVWVFEDVKNKNVEHILILSGDHLYRMNYMDFVQPPKFDFNDTKTPFFTSPRFLPLTKVKKCRIVDAIVSHGCFLRESSIQHSMVGVRLRLDYGVEFVDTMMMDADYYPTESEIASLLAEGKVPIGVGLNTKIRVLKKEIGQMKVFTLDLGSQS